MTALEQSLLLCVHTAAVVYISDVYKHNKQICTRELIVRNVNRNRYYNNNITALAVLHPANGRDHRGKHCCTIITSRTIEPISSRGRRRAETSWTRAILFRIFFFILVTIAAAKTTAVFDRSIDGNRSKGKNVRRRSCSKCRVI